MVSQVVGEATSYINSDILSDITTLIGQVTTWLTGNIYLSIFFTVALVGLAIGLFKRLRGVLRG